MAKREGQRRNYEDICDTIREFMGRGVVIRTVINGMTFDGATKDAMQRAVRDALIAFMAATAQAQAEATKEAQRAGIAHAKANTDAHTRVASRATAASSSRTRGPCWGGLPALAKWREPQDSRGRPFTGSRITPQRRKLHWLLGECDRVQARRVIFTSFFINRRVGLSALRTVIRAFEEWGVIFTKPTKTRGPGGVFEGLTMIDEKRRKGADAQFKKTERDQRR